MTNPTPSNQSLPAPSIEALYSQEFPDTMSFDAISAKLDSMGSHPAIAQLRPKFCYQVAFVLTDGFTQYEQISLEMEEGSLLKLFYENIKKLDAVSTDSFFFEAFWSYLQKEYNKCKDNIHKLCHVQWKQDILKEDQVLDYLLVPFQNASDEIWNFIMDEVNSMQCEEGIPEFCKALSLYYRSRDNDVIIEGLLAFMRKFPNYRAPNELLGYTYYNMAMWNNAIACFERVQQEYYFFHEDIYWMLAWSNGKIKNYADEEKYYRMSYQLAPDIPFTLNNLGYSLYKQKKYLEAKELFGQCLDANKDLPYAANNYVRVLIALGRNADAKKFVNSKKFKIAKAIQERVKRLDDHNVRLNKKDLSVKSDTIIESDSDTADLFEITSSEDEIKRCQQYTNNRLSENGAKCQQPSNEMQLESKTKHQRFSNERSLEGEIKHSQPLNERQLEATAKHLQFSKEKLLEEELTARIESGMPVFGKHLKVYKRKGEYGRQYNIPVGRLDLLCEDANGNLYVVELKKDSGYDDVYEQITQYLAWFEQSEKFKGKKVYGIICLNHPAQELLSKVHADKRIRIFEYQISYTEL
jgi:tetratricopeptide (TPR) repeat protein